ncbi:TrmH family RNA methyltransferase [Prevotella fusca JCM 17724]|uniref:RNA methyltransferase n=3 Tax=Prevotella fusca TaxID=589436 RepID=A0A0K1NK53_9BACT|nr:TrmH family RNA methyltransferase [Prevotella fusca]AKU69464.1 RNA methyltransferase [Prevotella fusca JCM 17724]QUB87102.1 TrmH family RNA methyltransferase [Prevotella fusca JCM 17724]
MRKLRTIEMNRLSLEEFKEADKLPLIVVLDDVRSLYNVGSVFRSADAFRVEAVYLCGITATPPNAEIHKTALGGEDSVDWRYFERTEDAIEELHRQGVFVYSVEQVEGSTKLQELNTSVHDGLNVNYNQHSLNTHHPPHNTSSTPITQHPTHHQHPTPITHHPTPNTSSTPNTQHPSPITHHPSPITHYAIVMGNEVKGVKQSVVDMSDGCLEIPQFGTKHSLNVSVTTGIVIWEFARQLLMK